jgi:hypothetical protein
MDLKGTNDSIGNLLYGYPIIVDYAVYENYLKKEKQ